MIVRIATEGQYSLDSSYYDQLNTIDNRLVQTLALGDQEAFRVLFGELLDIVRTHGTRLSAEDLVESHVVLPPPDTTFEEATELFTGEGLVPS